MKIFIRRFYFSFIISAFASVFNLVAPLRVLVLHGKGTNGEIYKRRLNPLVQSVSLKNDHVEWFFPNAPHLIKLESSVNHHQPTNTFEWWRLGEGERSFTADFYDGVQSSIRFVEEFGSVDAIIGHSQGAILASILIARGVLGQSSFLPKKFILSGAAWPKPYGYLLEMLKAEKVKQNIKSLHVIGTLDEVNPPEMAEKLCNLLGGEILLHAGGHSLPLDSAYLDKYVEFLLS